MPQKSTPDQRKGITPAEAQKGSQQKADTQTSQKKGSKTYSDGDGHVSFPTDHDDIDGWDPEKREFAS